MRSRGTTTTRGLTATRGRARTAGVIAVVLAVAGLAGCTGDDPAPTPPATTEPVEETPSPTPTPTPAPTDPAAVPPERPSAMDTVDTAGAEAVATYFLRLFAYALATNDAREWTALSHAECIYCSNVTDLVNTQASNGLHSEGGLDTIASASATEVDPGRWWAVKVELSQGPSRTVADDGTVTESYPDTVEYAVDLAVIREGDRWLVREVTFTETSRAVG